MNRLSAFARACHPAPTVVVTFVITAFAWSLGWRLPGLAGVLLAVLVGQLSIGWSNDAFDADLDATVGRGSKPTVAGDVTARGLWLAAATALVLSAGLSWAVAGLVGGTLHVFSVLMAWLYNTVLSRTPWSWLPYALAFGAVFAFFTYGLDGSAPPAWTVAVFAIVGVSAHLANAVPDINADRAAGVDGLAVRLGTRASLAVCWALLGIGTLILAVVTWVDQPWLAVIVIAVLLVAGAVAISSRRKGADFVALMAVVAIDVVVLVVAAAQGG
ncbi:MAG: UbiA family prenyltransferase [Actinobacteria bacterium]|nr:UbiA family prenyltransferase [Actinomycetota bacterium]